MPGFERDCLDVQMRDDGHGLPFVFQQVLGGDLNQPSSVYRPPAGVRLIAFLFDSLQSLLGMVPRPHEQTELK
jgi:hypothetical protein